MICFREIDSGSREKVCSIIAENWGSAKIITRGKVHDACNQYGYIAEENGSIQGLITYWIENGECEITSFNSFSENCGIGTTLLKMVINRAEELRCKRVWLITTNDNTKAIRYYQRRGFKLVAAYIDAIAESRKLKPEIPLIGFDDIPIEHELEFEKRL